VRVAVLKEVSSIHSLICIYSTHQTIMVFSLSILEVRRIYLGSIAALRVDELPRRVAQPRTQSLLLVPMVQFVRVPLLVVGAVHAKPVIPRTRVLHLL
jgi:hypothetical protein